MFLNMSKKIKIPREDGPMYINLGKVDANTIGGQLAPGYGKAFNTLIGKVGSIKNGMNYIVTKGYPKDVLAKTRLNKSDLESIQGKHKVYIPNYWAVVVYLAYERINSDKELMQQIKDLPDDVVFTSYTEYKNNSLGVEAKVKKLNVEMSRYVAVIRTLVDLIKKDKFDTETILELIHSAKEKPELSIFDSVPFSIETKI